MMNKEFLESILGRLKIFWMSMILVFFVVSLQYLGVHAPNMFPLLTTKLQAVLAPFQQVFPTPSSTTQAVNSTQGGE